MDEAENQINDLEHKETENNQAEQQETKIVQKIQESVRSLWNNCKQTNIHLIGVPEREKKEQEKKEFGNL